MDSCATNPTISSNGVLAFQLCSYKSQCAEARQVISPAVLWPLCMVEFCYPFGSLFWCFLFQAVLFIQPQVKDLKDFVLLMDQVFLTMLSIYFSKRTRPTSMLVWFPPLIDGCAQINVPVAQSKKACGKQVWPKRKRMFITELGVQQVVISFLSHLQLVIILSPTFSNALLIGK